MPEKLSEVVRLGLAAWSATERRFSGGVFLKFLAVASGSLMRTPSDGEDTK